MLGRLRWENGCKFEVSVDYSQYPSGHTEQDPLNSNETLVLPDGSVDNVPTTQAEEPVFTPQNPRELSGEN